MRSRRLALLLSVALAIATGAIVLAVHDTGVFELDGDADVNQAQHDWAEVWADSLTTPKGTSSGAKASSFAAEPDRQASIFTGGGSKDGLNVDQWAWKDGAGGLPDKDNLLHSFAARYSLTPTDPLGPTEHLFERHWLRP